MHPFHFKNTNNLISQLNRSGTILPAAPAGGALCIFFQHPKVQEKYNDLLHLYLLKSSSYKFSDNLMIAQSVKELITPVSTFQFVAGVLEFPSGSVAQLMYLIYGNLSILGGLYPCG